MLTYERFYKIMGTHKIAHFVNPRFVLHSELVFPMNSMYFWYVPSDVLLTLSNTGLLLNVKQPIVKTVTEYNTQNPLGKYRSLNYNEKKIIAKNKKVAKGFKYILPGKKNINIANKQLFIFNYGGLGYNHRYSSHPENLYFKWYNSINTVITNITNTYSGGGRHKFLVLELPDGIPSLQDIRKYLKTNNRIMLDTFHNYKRLNVLELFRFVDAGDKLSVFKQIPTEEYSDIDLMLTHKQGVAVVNLNVLYTLVKDNQGTANISKYSLQTIQKLLYVYINNIISMSPKEILSIDVESIEKVNINNLNGITSSDDTDVALNNNEVDLDILVNTQSNNNGVDNDVYEEDNTKEILTTIQTEDVDDVTEEAYNSDLETIVDPTTTLKDNLLIMKDNKMLSTQQYKSSLEKVNNRINTINPYPGETGKLKDMLKYNNITEITDTDISITDNAPVLDKSMNKDLLSLKKKEYVNKIYKKDILNTINSLQTTGYIIVNHTITLKENVLGGTEDHTLNVKHIDGSKSTIRFKLPILKEDGTFKMSSSDYILRNQRTDLPIRKISNTEVSLNSYYGKLFISKATFKKDDIGFWFRKQLVKKYEIDDELRDLVLLPVENIDVDLPTMYGYISRYTKSFRYGNRLFYFEHITRSTILKDKSVLEELEESEVVLVGLNGTIPIVMNMKNKLFEYKNDKYVAIPNILELLDINTTNAPMEFINIRIMKKQVPVIVLLVYYIGLTNVLNLLNVKYDIVDSSKRTTVDNNSSYKVKFKDKTIVIDKTSGYEDLILGGLSSLANILKLNNMSVLSKRTNMNVIFNQLSLPVMYINEIKLLEDNFVDPMTGQVLEIMKEPKTLKGLLIRSAELLLDDNYKHPNDISNMIIKGYERIPGMLYKELMSAVKQTTNKSHFSKSKLVIDPYVVIKDINEDSTTVIVDDLNPIASLKQDEDLSVLGMGGRSKETMVKKTRLYHKSALGVISESSKDSGDIGITAYMTASPKITNVRGTIGTSDIKKDGWTSTLSTSALITPFSTKDDMKRIAFINGQNSHVIPMNDMKVPYVRTGYESILPARVADKFCTTAIEDGTVVSVSDRNIKVKYKDKGNKTYKLYEWTTKEESGSCYTHTVVTDLKKGDTFIKDDTLTYDKLFFEQDIFNSNRVVYKAGSFVTTVLMEDTQTYEDSAAISNKLNHKLGTEVTKVKSIIVDVEDNIFDMVNIGDKVTYDTLLFTIVDKLTGDVSNLDAKAKSIIKSLNSKSPKSKTDGVISKIEVRYNSELKDMSTSLKKLVKTTDIYMLDKYGYDGYITGSYSIDGKPLLPGSIEIKIYIKSKVGMGIGDKAIVASQLKFTVGEVFDYTMTGSDGTNIELVFSNRSVAARIVNSADLVGTASMVMEKLQEKAVNMYFGE